MQWLFFWGGGGGGGGGASPLDRTLSSPVCTFFTHTLPYDSYVPKTWLDKETDYFETCLTVFGGEVVKFAFNFQMVSR